VTANNVSDPVNTANGADPSALVGTIVGSLGNANVQTQNVVVNSVTPVVTSGARRTSSGSVTITYTIQTSASTQSDVATSANNANLQSGLSSAGISGSSATNSLTGTSTVTSTAVATGTCHIVTTLGVLPVGATLTTDQAAAVASSFQVLVGLPSTTTVTVTSASSFSGVTVTAARDSACLTDAELASEGGLFVSISYTASDSSVATTSVVTQASQASTTSSSSSFPVVAVAVGAAVGGVALIVILVVVIMRAKRNAQVGAK